LHCGGTRLPVCHIRPAINSEPRTEYIMPETTTKRIERLMKTKSIKDMLTENARAKKQIENAIEYLITEHQATQPADEEILWTVERLREPLVGSQNL